MSLLAHNGFGIMLLLARPEPVVLKYKADEPDFGSHHKIYDGKLTFALQCEKAE